jgi:uncharacterized membrane protein YedE/YeeE
MELGTIGFAALGGLLIGLAAVLMMLLTGRIAGMSGVVSGLLQPKPGDVSWRVTFIAGLVTGGVLLALLRPEVLTFGVARSLPAVAVAGLLVGFGARLGSGCTSGHGVCGVARLGPRSLVATAIFLATGVLAAVVVSRLLGGSI